MPIYNIHVVLMVYVYYIATHEVSEIGRMESMLHAGFPFLRGG